MRRGVVRLGLGRVLLVLLRVLVLVLVLLLGGRHAVRRGVVLRLRVRRGEALGPLCALRGRSVRGLGHGFLQDHQQRACARGGGVVAVRDGGDEGGNGGVLHVASSVYKMPKRGVGATWPLSAAACLALGRCARRCLCFGLGRGGRVHHSR